MSTKKCCPGEVVIAMGSPFQFKNTATMGVVSCNNRHVDTLDIYYIQTDAATNVGSSAGLLLGLYCEVIGVHRGGSVAAGFGSAIPSDVVIDFLKDSVKQNTLMSPVVPPHHPAYHPPKHENALTLANISSRKQYVGLSALTLTPRLVEDLNECGGISLNLPYSNVNSSILITKVVAWFTSSVGRPSTKMMSSY